MNDENLTSSIITNQIVSSVLNKKNKVQNKNAGIAVSIDNDIIKVEGFYNAFLMEKVIFSNGCIGFVYDIGEYLSYVLIINDKIDDKVSVGSFVEQTGQKFSAPVGNFSGRILNCLMEPIDDGGDLEISDYFEADAEPIGVIERRSVNEPLYTGLVTIDTSAAMGRGQRSLIMGNRKTGKTSITIDAIINQVNLINRSKINRQNPVFCIYVAIGQKQQDIVTNVERLKESGAMQYTTVIACNSSESSANVYITPYMATALAEYMCHQLCQDVLIVYDDLSKHAMAQRTIDLILRKLPGREGYSGDVFYLHARLLERSGAFAYKKSITSYAIVEIQEGDISSYIGTNIISITDGQLFLDSEYFHNGIRPAINIGRSVSRIGSAAQEGVLKYISSDLKLMLSRYENAVAQSKVIHDLDKETKLIINNGNVLSIIMTQDIGQLYSPLEMSILIIAAKNHIFIQNKEDKNLSIKEQCIKILEYFKKNHQNLIDDYTIQSCNNMEKINEYIKQVIDILKKINLIS